MVLNITCCNSNLLDTYRRTMTYHGLSTHSSSRLEGVLKPIVCALACALPSLAWSAPTTPTDDVAAQAVVVTATRTDKPLQEASGSLAVISAERLAAESPSTLFEALGTIPNVNVESADSVISGKVSIRGGDFNQNIYLIDGLRQDNYTMSGNHPVGLFVDPELIKQIEVKRGGGSVLYGNGGIAGVIATTTKSAADFLDPDETAGITVKSGYDAAAHEWSKSAYVYGRTDNLDALIAVTRRDGGDLKLSAPTTATDRQAEQTGFMAKVSLAPTDESTLSLSYHYDDADDHWIDENLPLGYGYEQHRVTGSYLLEDGPLLNLKASVQWSRSDYDYQTAYQNPMGAGTIRNGDTFESLGLTLQNTSDFTLGVAHNLTVGVDAYRSTQDSFAVNPLLNGGSNESNEDSQRPNAEALDLGLFVTDAIGLSDRITLTPGIRFNYYKRTADDPTLDANQDHEITPSLMLEVKPVDGLTVWASGALGYRPPSMDELFYNMPVFRMGDMTLPLYGTVLANPNLKAEKSRNYEVGMTADFGSLLTDTDRLSVRTALFYSDLRDGFHINEWKEQDNQYYQVVNLNRIVRKGVELSANYRIGNATFDLGYGYLHATNEETGKREEGVSPQNVSLRAGYTLPSAALQSWYRLNWSEKAPTQSTNPLYKDVTTHAVGLTWSPRPANFWEFTANIAVENLTNERYLRSVSTSSGGTTGFGRAVRVWVSGKF